MTLLRHPVNPADYKRGYDDQTINDACNTLYGTGDRALVLSAMVDRFARVLKRVEDGDTGTVNNVLVNFTTQIDGPARAAILAGQFEVARPQWYENIVGAQANLFSESGLRYEYDNDKAGDTIAAVRLASGTALASQRWDTVACGVGSCPLFIEAVGSKITEREVRPTALWVIFADAITEDGKERATDPMNIDEASVVIMELTGAEQYAAWFGPSELYPVGRHVMFTAKKFSDIPPPDSKDGREYTTSGEYKSGYVGADELANPLTLWGDYSKSAPPVYPFSILYGSPQSTGLLPVSTSLFEQCLEYDLTASLILGATGRGAVGAQVLTNPKGDADPSDIPENVREGKVIMGRGRELNFAGWSPTHAAAAFETLKGLARATAEAASVPGGMAIRDDTAKQESGYHYRLQLSKLFDYRKARISANTSPVMRRWEIEKALINATVGKRTIPDDTVETWNPGEYDVISDPTEEMADWEARIKAGEASILDVVMSRRGFSNPADALAWMTTRKDFLETNAEVIDYFKPSAPAAAPARGGLFGPRG